MCKLTSPSKGVLTIKLRYDRVSNYRCYICVCIKLDRKITIGKGTGAIHELTLQLRAETEEDADAIHNGTTYAWTFPSTQSFDLRAHLLLTRITSSVAS
jgi:hypothetical protein